MTEGNQAVRRAGTDELSVAMLEEIRSLMTRAFARDEHGGFSDDDWQHAIGGTHFLLSGPDGLASHASVVERDIRVAGRSLHCGYVEAVATEPSRQRRGYGSAVMRAVNEYLAATFELGALGTSSQAFYERLGWQVWRGPTSVRLPAGDVPTPQEDGYILVLLTPSTPPLDLLAPISCDWRAGDAW
jgi:aminoglycoside 2'-N-acetyltransferase I